MPILQQYKADDIFNADETGLYWRLLPDKTHAVAGETCTVGKKSKDRVILLVCANMTGTEKRPLLTIGKNLGSSMALSIYPQSMRLIALLG